jgi:hypothetical protein
VVEKALAVSPPGLTGIGLNGKIGRIVREKTLGNMKIYLQTEKVLYISHPGF